MRLIKWFNEWYETIKSMFLGLLMWGGVGFVLFFFLVICNPFSWFGLLIISICFKLLNG